MTARSYYAAKREAARKGLRTGFCNASWSLDTPDGRASHERCTFVQCVCECHQVMEAHIYVTEQAVELVPADGYLSPEWYEARRDTVSASEIAAVLGLSPWTSPFDLWWAKRTGVDSQDENQAMRRGKRLEPLIIEDFTDRHPEFIVGQVGLVRNVERPWQACTPDGLVYDRETPCTCDDETRCAKDEPVAVIECKTDGDASAWGEEGTDDIPVKYRCQVLWQMDTLGLNVAYVPVWLGVNYREYVVEYHEADVMLMRGAAEAFLESVREDRQPDIDSHVATGRRLKRLHPELVDEVVDVPATLVRQYQAARRLKKAAEDRMRLAENRVRALIGPASHGAVDLGDGEFKRFSHTRTDIKERTQTVRAHTKDVINFPRKEI
jgi:putative phage-type endonuclease